MKAFRFRLEPILTLRNWEEERARIAYSQALQQEQRFAETLRAADVGIEQEIKSWQSGRGTVASAGERSARWRHLLRLERERRDIAAKLATARRLREQKMKVLVDIHRRVRVLETLRGKLQQAHLLDARRREEKEIEEIVSSRFQPGI